MSNTTPRLIFYDIASGPPRRTFAPNPWKTRYALNLKAIPYATHWVELPEVTRYRRDVLHVPAVRKHQDGEEFYTLPILEDTATGQRVGDTFDIALYLDNVFPAAELRLIPDGQTEQVREWNATCDHVFSGYHTGFSSAALLFAHGMPLNPANAEIFKRESVARVPGATSWDDFCVSGERREVILQGLEGVTGKLVEAFERRGEGPFVGGGTVAYKDCILGGWLKCLQICLPREEWERICGWYGGLFGEHTRAMERWAAVDDGVSAEG